MPAGDVLDAYVTVSIDDGTRHDMRTAELLAQHGLRATFYVPAAGPRELGESELRTLDERFELGSHTAGHVDLTTVPSEEAAREIREGKAWLEDVLGHPTAAFAYPSGRFDATVAALVSQAGLACARTCLLNRTETPQDPFRLPITADAYPHLRRVQVRHALRERNYLGLGNYLVSYRLGRDWEALFGRALERVRRSGGVAHLVVHSADIESRGDWHKLDRVLRAAAESGLTPATNTETAPVAR